MPLDQEQGSQAGGLEQKSTLGGNISIATNECNSENNNENNNNKDHVHGTKAAGVVESTSRLCKKVYVRQELALFDALMQLFRRWIGVKESRLHKCLITKKVVRGGTNSSKRS